MNPQKLLPILGTMICFALSGMIYFIASAVKNAPRVAQPGPNVFFTQEPTQTQEQAISFLDTYIMPSETPTPLDYGALPITQTAAAIESESAAAQATIAASGSTQVAISRINNDATATAQIAATEMANAQATSERIALDQKAKDEQNQAERNRIESEKQARATLSIVFEYVWKVGGSATLILAICLGTIYKFHVEKLKANRKAVERVTANFLDNLSPVTVQVSTDKHSGFEHTINITPSEMVVLKQAVIDLDGDLSRSKIVAGKYFPERRWNALDDELVKENADGVSLFERDTKGVHPTEAGYKLLGLKSPAPPLEEKSLETVKFPAIPVTSPSRHGCHEEELQKGKVL